MKALRTTLKWALVLILVVGAVALGAARVSLA